MKVRLELAGQISVTTVLQIPLLPDARATRVMNFDIFPLGLTI